MIYQGVQIDTKPTQAMADEAEKGLRWREEYGRGGTLVGVARANQLRRRDVLSVKTIKRMKAYFDRHAVDMEAPKNRDPNATGYPGAGLIAWLLWGGDSGKSWAERKVAEIRKIEERQMDTEQQRHVLGYEETENSIIIEFSKAEEEHEQDDDSGASGAGVDDARPYPNEHAARIEDPDRFVRFRRAVDEGGPGIDFIFGVDREGVSQVQAIRFDAERYTAAEARAWLAEHDFEPVEFEEATGEERGADEKDDETSRDAASVSLSYRSGSIERAYTEDEDDRRVRLAFSSEQPVERDFGFEVLDHSTDGVRLEFLNSGRAPLLLDHDARQQIGVVERVEIDGSARSARATVRLGRGSLAEEVYRDIQDGIRANISVGYRVLGMKRTDEEIEGRSIYRVSWEPMEISIVSIPADRSTAVGVGRSIEVKETKMTEEIKLEELAQVPTRNERKEIAEILSLGTRHQQRELAERAIHEGRSLEQFRGELLGALESKPLEKPLELTPKEERSYSLLRAIRAAGAQNWAEAGFEREVSDEIARRKGQDARGFWVPEQGWNVRTVKAVTGSSGSGANTIGEDYRPGNFIEALVSQSVVGTLGVQVLQGLQGDVAIPKMSASTSAGWIAEAGSVGNNEPTYAQVTMSPKTLANKVAVTRKMLIQSDPSVEQTVRNNITRVFAAAIDAGLLNGSGNSGQPTGILNTSGIGDVSSAGTSGNAALTYGNVVDIWSEVAADNALVGQLSWVTHPRVVGKLMQTLVESSTDSRMIMMDPTSLLGYNVVQTTQMPSSAPYALLFGNFSDALLGFYSGLDVVVDPYASAGNATTNLYFYQDVDVAVAHAESFAAAQDVTVA